MNKNWLKSAKGLLGTICFSLLVGCAPSVGSIIMEANRQDSERATARGKDLLAEHLKLIEKLRAEGDPMGDYLWTRANADAWVPNPIKDPLVLKKMYEDAAAKGSVDAQHVLGLMLFLGGASQTAGANPQGPLLSKNDRDPFKGMAMIEEASKKQCWHWTVLIAGGGSSGRYCLMPEIAAGRIWPKFRDGFMLPKNAASLKQWRELDESCEATIRALPPTFFNQKFPACR